MNKKNIYFKGSYTVEASFILPMVLTVMVILIYLSFFLHNRSVLNCVAYTSALRGSQMINGEDVFSEVEKNVRSLVGSRLIAMDYPQVDISITDENITVDLSGYLKIPAGTLLTSYLIHNKDGISVAGKGSAKKYDPVGFIRKCRVVENVKDKL